MSRVPIPVTRRTYFRLRPFAFRNVGLIYLFQFVPKISFKFIETYEIVFAIREGFLTICEVLTMPIGWITVCVSLAHTIPKSFHEFDLLDGGHFVDR